MSDVDIYRAVKALEELFDRESLMKVAKLLIEEHGRANDVLEDVIEKMRRGTYE